MSPQAATLVVALVAAYRPYLSKVSAANDMAQAMIEGEAWLESTLSELLDLPFHQQRRGPLEVFQEALRFPTEALSALGVPAPSRGEAAVLPGDIYGLAPASSQDLGEAAWEAHIAWGVVKAATLTTVGWFGRDLTDRSKVEAAAAAAGRRLLIAPSDLSECGLVIIDLDHPDAASVLAEATGGGWPTVAYGPHVDKGRLAKASAAGAVAVARSKFFADPALFLR